MPISMLLDMAADAYDDRVALGSRSDGVTYAQLRRAAAGGASIIAESGAKHVAFIGTNGPAFVLLLFASSLAGVPITPLNYRLSAGQLHELIGELAEPFIVGDNAYFEAVCGATTGDVRRSEDWFDDCFAAPEAPPIFPDDAEAAVVLFTSGTTSKPKGVVLKHENLVSYVLQTVEFLSADPDAAALISVPPYHVAGVGTALTNVYAGRRMVYLPNFSAEAWLEIVRDELVSNAMLVPTMLSRILDDLGGQQADTPSLQALAYGGARTPRTVVEAALAAFPNTDFVNAYGLTETSSTIAVLGPEDHREALASDDPLVAARLGSTGRIVPGMEGQVRGVDGSVLGPHEVGELWVRGPQVSGEYAGIGSVLDVDGWFPTRDRAWFDADGYLFIEGRSDDTIIRGGENIAPAEIEDVLIHHPGVRDVAVVGMPDDEWGEKIVACVVPGPPPPDAIAVREYVRVRLRGSRTPGDVVFFAELPYNPTGKLLRRQLTSDLAALAATTKEGDVSWS